MADYKKKAVDVVAEQFQPDKLPWPPGVVATYHIITDGSAKVAVEPDDWIIAGQTAETGHPVNPVEFAVDYELGVTA